MSENQKNYVLYKTTPMSVLFILHPYSNPGLQRRVYLTDQNPKVALPQDWALGVFQDEEVFRLFRNKCITFDNNEGITKAAFEAGVYFEELDFKPAEIDRSEKILATIKAGNHSKILKVIEEEGKDVVAQVAAKHLGELSTTIVKMLESALKVQLEAIDLTEDTDEDK